MRDLEIRGAGNLLGDEQSGHVAALGFELYMQMLDEAVGGRERRPMRIGTAQRTTGSRCASTSMSTPTCPPTTSPTSRRRSTCTGASRRRVRSPTSWLLREELEDRFGELPEPLENLISLQTARIKLGQAGARAVTFRGGRLAVTPIELDSVRAKKIRAAIPEALYESGKSQLSMRVPEDPRKRFPAVVRAADVLLAVTREAA